MNEQEKKCKEQEFELTSLDWKQTLCYAYSDQDNAFRMKLIGAPVEFKAKLELPQNFEQKIIEIEKPVIHVQKEIEIREIEKPIIHIQKEIEIREIEKPVIVKEHQLKVVEVVKEVPVYIDKFQKQELDIWFKIAIIAQCLIGLGLILDKLI